MSVKQIEERIELLLELQAEANKALDSGPSKAEAEFWWERLDAINGQIQTAAKRLESPQVSQHNVGQAY